MFDPDLVVLAANEGDIDRVRVVAKWRGSVGPLNGELDSRPCSGDVEGLGVVPHASSDPAFGDIALLTFVCRTVRGGIIEAPGVLLVVEFERNASGVRWQCQGLPQRREDLRESDFEDARIGNHGGGHGHGR